MQGRDPDHDDAAPGQDPAPDRGYASSEPFGYPSFPVPDNPYDEMHDGDADDGDSGVAASAATGATDPPSEPPPSPPVQRQQPDAPETPSERESPRGLFEPRHQVPGRSPQQASETEQNSGPQVSRAPSGQASGQASEAAPQAEGPTAHDPPGLDLPDGDAEAHSAPTETFRPASPGESHPGGSEPQDSAWEQPPGEPDTPPDEPGTPGRAPPVDHATEQFHDVGRTTETPDEAQEPASPEPLSGPAHPLPGQPATERFGPVRRDGAVGSASEPASDEFASGQTEAGESAEHPAGTSQSPGPLGPYTQQFKTVGAAGMPAARPQSQPPTTEPPTGAPADVPADTPADTPAETPAETPADSAADPTPDYPRGAADSPQETAESPQGAATGYSTDPSPDTPADPHSRSAEPATESLRLAGREPGQQPPGPFGAYEPPPHPSSVPRQSPHDRDSAHTATWASPHPDGGASPPSGVPPYGHGQPGPGAGTASPTNTVGQTPDLSHDVADLYRRPPKRRRGLLIASLVLVAVLVVGGGAFAYTFFFADGVGPGQPLAGTSTPAASNAAQPSADGGSPPNAAPSFDPRKVSNATVDPEPLALGEAFPKGEITVDGRKFRRVDMSLASECGNAAQQGFAKALRQADCTRVLRATFVDSENEYAVTTGIAVLPNEPAAKSVEKAAHPGENIWFAALPGPQGSGSERIHRSGGYSALEVLGRYAVFSFAAYTDKITPPPQSKDLSDVCAAMRNYTAKPVLTRGIVAPEPGAHGRGAG